MNRAVSKSLDLVDAAKKKYEDISVKRDPVFNDVIDAIKIVKDFIRRKKLIIYGGTAIDFALRLKGDAIYTAESLLFPDLDFFSPDSVGDAYELSMILYKAGWPDTRAIVATYVRTMRVDIEKNHFIADITYLNPEIFNKLTTIEFEGMRVLPPEFQKIDLHLSLSYPFDKAPREVIFERWKKDIERYNLLDKYYPSRGKVNEKIFTREEVKLPIKKWMTTAALNGFAAYAAICAAYEELVAFSKRLKLKSTSDESEWAAKNKDIIPHKFVIAADSITFENIKDIPIVITSYNTEAALEELFVDPAAVTHKASILKLIEECYEGKINGGQTCRIYNGDSTLTSAHIYDVQFNKKLDTYLKIKTVSVQIVFAYLLSMAELSKLDKIALVTPAAGYTKSDLLDLFNAYYHSTQCMVNNSVDIYADVVNLLCNKESGKPILNKFITFSMFLPSIIISGYRNESETYKSSLINLFKMKGDDATASEEGGHKYNYSLPVNFYPGRYVEKGESAEMPVFDYSKSKFFMKNGEEL